MAASNHTNLQAQNKDGQNLSFQHTTTDSPLLPAENLRQLHAINPELVTWVITQTEQEAGHRRRQESRINWFILVERMSGVIAGAGVAIFGLSAGTYLILRGHDMAGVGISGVGLASIVSVLVARRGGKSAPAAPSNQAKRQKNTGR